MLMTANINAVRPSSSLWLMSTPSWISSLTVSVSPSSAARMRAVCPCVYSSAALNSARVVIIPPALAADVRLFLKRGVQQVIHRRSGLVTRHEALAKITGEVVVGRCRACLDYPADRLCEPFLHSQPGKRFDDRCHFRIGHRLVTPATPIQADAHRRHRNLGLFVKRDGRRRVERDAIPDQL